MKPKEQANVYNQTIKDFFNEYPSGQHSDLLYDVISICALDEKSGISDNRKYSLVSFLEGCNELLFEIQPNTSLKIHKNVQRNDKLKESVSLLCQPFFEKEPSSENIEKRSNYDHYVDYTLVKQLSNKQLQLEDIATRFFVRYGLKEAFDLLASLTDETSNKGELVRFKTDLKHFIFALYTISKEQAAQPLKEKGDCYAK